MFWPSSLHGNTGPATRRVCPGRWVRSLLGSHARREKSEFRVHETRASAPFADREDELQTLWNEAEAGWPQVGGGLTTLWLC